MPPPAFTFRLAPQLSVKRRAIGFLEGDARGEFDAGKVFDSLAGNAANDLRHKMDLWIDGSPNLKKYFHGWDAPLYKQCFVFKQKKHRFYGFLCNPKPRSDPGFRLCVLIYHDTKNEYESNYRLLDRINSWRQYLAVKVAIGRTYPEFKEDKQPWLN